MRVVIVTPQPANGPKPNLRALRQYRALIEAGHEPELFSVTLLGDTPRGLGRIAYYRQWTAALVSGILGGPHPDLIVTHDIYTLAAGARAAKKLGVPLVYDSHEDWPALISEHSRLESMAVRFIERRAARHIAHVLVPSDLIRRRFESAGLRTTVTYNARSNVEIRRIPKAEARASLGLSPDAFIVGYIGAMEQLFKGRVYDLVLRAVSHLPPSVELIVIGGPERDTEILAGMVEGDLGIHVLNPMKFDDLAPYYSSLDAGLVALDGTRKNYYNSLPNKLWDYMAFGLPVLVPPFPEMEAVVTNGKGGLVYTDLAETVRYMVGLDAVKRSQMAYAAYETFIRHSWDIQAPKFVKICEGLVGRESLM